MGDGEPKSQVTGLPFQMVLSLVVLRGHRFHVMGHTSKVRGLGSQFIDECMISYREG